MNPLNLRPMLVASLCLAPLLAQADTGTPTPICVTEYGRWYGQPADMFAQRLRLYEEIGVGMLRVETGWESGGLIEELLKTDLRVKLILYVLGLPPGHDRPDEAMIDEHGVSDWHFGPWHTGLAEHVRAAADAQMAMLRERGVLDRIDEVCADLGPAAEGIYPANWTLDREGPEEAFWCYSPAAQADFRRAMREQYGEVASANRAWGLEDSQAFAAWDDVLIPPPGTPWARGPFWNDMLTWYRDSKRGLMRLQMDNTIAVTKKYLGDRAKVVVYLPGWAYTQEDWDEAVATASGPMSIRLMMDNDWIMDEALRRGCVLQCTGVENANEVRRIAAKLRDRGHADSRILWGENAGVEASGRNPLWLAGVIGSFGLRGIDYTWSNWLFEEDTVTPSATFAEFKRAVDALRVYYATGDLPDLMPDPEDAVRNPEPGVFELSAVADTRLMGSYPDHMKGHDPEIAVVEGGQSQRILLRFPVGHLPKGGVIGKATLHLTGNIDYGDEVPAEVHVYRVTEPWQEIGVTWRDRALGEPWTLAGGDAVGRDGRALGGEAPITEPFASALAGTLPPGKVIEWDVTGLVAQWHGGVEENHGMLLVMAPGDTGNKSVCSREHPEPENRPVLRVVMPE